MAFPDACQSHVPTSGSNSIHKKCQGVQLAVSRVGLVTRANCVPSPESSSEEGNILNSSGLACLHPILKANIKACRNYPELQSRPLDCHLQHGRTPLSKVSLRIHIISSCTNYSLEDSLHLPFSS